MSKKSDEDNQLTELQVLFCKEYLKDLNGTEAAKRAGYSEDSAHVMASRLLGRPHIKRFINRLKSDRNLRLQVDSDSVLAELTRLAFVDLAQLYDDKGALKDIRKIPKNVRRAISSVEIDELFTGFGKDREQIGLTKKIKLYDKTKALELIGKHLKMFPNSHEHTGANGKPIENKFTVVVKRLDKK